MCNNQHFLQRSYKNRCLAAVLAETQCVPAGSCSGSTPSTLRHPGAREEGQSLACHPMAAAQPWELQPAQAQQQSVSLTSAVGASVEVSESH